LELLESLMECFVVSLEWTTEYSVGLLKWLTAYSGALLVEAAALHVGDLAQE
jgi:hypothetical protein